ncbi:MAG: hypothetical protein LBG23_02285 [Endomicrobium sp.]|nr:hypothetical protein [Endomicrobium sp.]
MLVLLIKPKRSFTNIAIVDLSVLLDGRIYDVINTRFLNFDLIIPSFVIDELKNITKSLNHTQRATANKSLATIDMLKKLSLTNINILKTKLSNKEDYVSKIVNIAKAKKAQIITKNFEVYKFTSLNKIPVLNFNDLEASLYPIFLPGQSAYVYLIKDGMQYNQAIGYFDEKTTIVVKDGKNYIGKNVQIVITSSMVTPNGRLVFGKVLKVIQ